MGNCCWFRAYAGSALLIVGFCCASGSAMAQPDSVNHFLLAQANSYSTLGGNMAGYVLNAGTNQNSLYMQRVNRELMYPAGPQKDEEPLIQYEGPPPQAPPIGPLYQRSTQAWPILNPRP